MNTDQRFRCFFPPGILFTIAIGLLTALVSIAAENLQPIFDGKTLAGWVERGGKAKCTVEEGCIVPRASSSAVHLAASLPSRNAASA